MWKEVSLLLMGAFVGALIEALIDRVKARTAAEYWEAQERWKFKADVYSRILSGMRRLRQQLEMPATRGVWPEGEERARLYKISDELIEPAMLAALWLPRDATDALTTQGDRLLALRNTGASTKAQLMQACSLIQADIDRIVAIARDDLRLEETHRQTRWRSFWTVR
jgi:hypothetical protein